jgi:peptide/nickel transport system permease protein
MLMVNTVWSVPTLLLVFAVVLALGRGISVIFLAVGLTMWVDVGENCTRTDHCNPVTTLC